MDNKKSYFTIEGKTIELPDDLVNRIKNLINESTTSLSTIYEELFHNKHWFINSVGTIIPYTGPNANINHNSCVTKTQAENLLELNKLINVAIYLNNGWIPDWKNNDEYKYSIYINYVPDKPLIQISDNTAYARGIVHFKSRELVQKAIKILGEESILKALTRY